MSAPASDTPPDDVSHALTALVARLRDAGVAPGVEELADALWLARWLPPGDGRTARPVPDPAGPEPERRDGTGSLPQPSGPVRATSGAGESQQADGARLFAPGPGSDDDSDSGTGSGTRMTPVRVPSAPALPEPLALQRGLRPLQRYRAPVRPVARTLDEHATADRAAESGLVLPVLRPDRRREARLLLLMDVSTSTVVWQQAFDELWQVCARAGAFREVQTRYLHESPGGLPGCSARPDPRGPLHAPEQLRDPTGRRVTLVLSDCAGPMWRSGRMQRLLHGWAATAPVAVVQPLPQRMWLRTHLPARRGLLHRREGPAGALEFLPDRGRAERGALPVPVLALRRDSVEGWARLVSGATGQSLAAAAGWVRAGHPASGAPVRAAEELTGEERVRAFWRPASAEARRLAVYLSAVPLYLPVMQLVQHAMLAGSGPDVLSEVLLSGLLRRREDPDDPRAVRYDFLPGVARELRERLSVDEVELLFKHCSEYVERKFGRSVRNFPALAGAFLRGAVAPGGELSPLTGGPAGEGEPAGLRAFAEVSAEVLRDLGARLPAVPVERGLTAGELLSKGREAVGRFLGEGLTRELDAAVEYLRKAVDVARSQEQRTSAGEELANALLARWRVRGVGEDLREAGEAIAAPAAVTVRGSLILGLVSWAQAQGVVASGIDFAGLPAGVRDWALTAPDRPEDHACALLLYLADRDLTTVLHDADTAPHALARRRTAAEALAAVRRAVAELGPGVGGGAGPPFTAEEWYVAHLHRAAEAAGARLAFPEPERARVVRGRLWLALARQHLGRGRVEAVVDLDRLHAEYLATLATEDFLAAVGDESALPAAERCRVWLDAAAAIEIQQPLRGDGRERRMLLYAVDQALAAAGDDDALRFECHAWAARIYRARYDETGSLDQLRRAVEAWTQAEGLLGEDDPRRPTMLTEFGLVLFETARIEGTHGDAGRAVELLRRAIDESPPEDPGLPERLADLGLAYFTRYTFQHVLSDLYEAEWLFGEAVRGSDDPVFLAQCWIRRGSTLLFLHDRTHSRSRLEQALECYGRAAEYAEDAEVPEALADALRGRDEARNRISGAHASGPDPETATE
jgi:tetratricopeptide (TPR) repeat protein